MRNTIICVGCISRFGYNTDYVEGIDDVKPRSIINTIENHNGNLCCEFLSDVNLPC